MRTLYATLFVCLCALTSTVRAETTDTGLATGSTTAAAAPLTPDQATRQARREEWQQMSPEERQDQLQQLKTKAAEHPQQETRQALHDQWQQLSQEERQTRMLQFKTKAASRMSSLRTSRPIR